MLLHPPNTMNDNLLNDTTQSTGHTEYVSGPQWTTCLYEDCIWQCLKSVDPICHVLRWLQGVLYPVAVLGDSWECQQFVSTDEVVGSALLLPALYWLCSWAAAKRFLRSWRCQQLYCSGQKHQKHRYESHWLLLWALPSAAEVASWLRSTTGACWCQVHQCCPEASWHLPTLLPQLQSHHKWWYRVGFVWLALEVGLVASIFPSM